MKKILVSFGFPALVSRIFSTGLCFILLLLHQTLLYAQSGKIEANGIQIAYESLGSEDGEAVLLIAGTGMQLTSWPPAFCDALVSRGFRVIRYDNRDAGLSTRFDEAGEPDWPAIIHALEHGEPAPLAYTIDDMAKDAVGLLDALGIQKAHIVGISGGAIIAQIVAAHYAQHTHSLTSMLATSGNPALPPMKPEIQALLLSNPPPPATDTAAIVARQLGLLKALGSPAYPTDEKILKDLVWRDIRRSYHPEGDARQGVAAWAAGDRREDLKSIQVPTLVIHGEQDPIVPVEAGKDVAAHITGAELLLIPGMGHDLPLALIPTFVEAIAAVAARSKTSE